MTARLSLIASIALLIPKAAWAQALPTLPSPPHQAGEVNATVTPNPRIDAPRDSEIVVRGSLERRSSWRRADGARVTVYSNGSETELRRLTANLDREYALLQHMFGRPAAADETTRLRIVLIGGENFQRTMRLRNARSEEGPYAAPFTFQRFLDPRDNGPMIAVSRSDQVIPLTAEQADSESETQFDDGFSTGDPFDQFDADPSSASLARLRKPIRPTLAARAWESLVYSAFAQNHVLTQYPGAYPRWYLDGVGALFSTMNVRKDGTVEYGRTPEAFGPVYNAYDPVSYADVLAGTVPPRDWTPYHAWSLAHFFFFGTTNPDRRIQFARYMTDVANGKPQDQAAMHFGDKAALDREITAYAEGKTYFYTLAAPSVAEPTVTRLAISDATALKAKVEMTARTEQPGTAAGKAGLREMADFDRRRTAYLADLEKDASSVTPRESVLLTLAEAYCRSHDGSKCLSAAQRAALVNPASAEAFAWKAFGLTETAIGSSVNQRSEAVAAARAAIIAANRADTESVVPLIAYFRLHTRLGQPAPEAALLGMLKAIKLAPSAPGPRLELGRELIRQGMADQARTLLLPVAAGPYDSPERQEAAALLGGSAAALASR